MDPSSRPLRILRAHARVAALALSGVALAAAARQESGASRLATAAILDGVGTPAHEQEVMRSSYCAGCHPAIYAEHAENTHGRAFTDEEVRLATGRFSQGDCIICHTPRPVFETGIGQNPIRRHHDLEEGNSCMTCHWREGVDYASFVGGADCRAAFDPRVGEVEACASCHRNHGTPYQWELAPRGKASGRVCIDCHMPTVERPIAVGGQVREVRSHVFPGGRSESQLRRAYAYSAAIEGDEVVVRVTNRGAGHNFPTELKQRAVESTIVVRDAAGVEVARSRETFRDPYKRPYGLVLPVNTQIPSGETREHRVPLNVAEGTVQCELVYKLYYPIEDHHPDLARRLEGATLAFAGVTPAGRSVATDPTLAPVTPEGIRPELASPANLVDFARPAIGQVEVEIPEGATPADVERLIALFQFPVPQANAEARKRLTAIGAPAVPALIRALGSWDNKTWNQAMGVLEAIGAPAAPAVAAALDDGELYVRLHAAELVARMGLADEELGVPARLRAALARPNALDRSHAATALGELGLEAASGELRRLVETDRDPDVVRAAALALAALRDLESVPALEGALWRAPWDETRRDLARSLALLGDPSGVPVLLAGLDHRDDLIRESFFEAFFALTGEHAGYEPLGPRPERLAALSRLQAWWAREGGARALRRPPSVARGTAQRVHKIVEQIGGSDGTVPAGDDVALRTELVGFGREALPGILDMGMKYPSGFSEKRALLCGVLGEIGHPDAVPALIAALRDPVVAVAAWACDALGRIGDDQALPALRRYHSRLLTLAQEGRVPESAGSPQLLLAQVAGLCYRFGDEHLEADLVACLLGEDAAAREVAFGFLRERYGSELDFDPAADLPARRAALARWQASRR